MVERLFTYGSLQPGGEYAHLLQEAGDDWQAATVTGFFDPNGWGHSVGYPALILHDQGTSIPGMVITSLVLPDLWSRLDEFEGAAYERVMAAITLPSGKREQAFIYILNPNLHAPILEQLQLPRTNDTFA